jgi:hypothetical protein
VYEPPARPVTGPLCAVPVRGLTPVPAPFPGWNTRVWPPPKYEMNQPYTSHIQNQSLLFKNNSTIVMSYMLFTEEHALHRHTC